MDKVGRLNQRITLYQVTDTTRNEAGEKIPGTPTKTELFAGVKFKTVGSDEEFLAQRKVAVTAVNFTVRNNPNRQILATNEIVYRSRIFEILSILEEDPRRCYLTIEARQMGGNKIVKLIEKTWTDGNGLDWVTGDGQTWTVLDDE